MNNQELVELVKENPEVENKVFDSIEISKISNEQVVFRGCSFKNCHFVDDIAQELEMEECVFLNCEFRGVVDNCLIQFTGCNFEECIFQGIVYHSEDYQVSFSDNKYIRCFFHEIDINLDLMFMYNNMLDCKIDHLVLFSNMILSSEFENIIVQNSEFKCNIKTCEMKNVELEEVAFLQVLKGNKAVDCLLDQTKYDFLDQEGEFRG